MPSVSLELTGLNCASCVARAESAVSNLSNVSLVQVNLATKQADIHGDALNLPEIIDALKDAGYPAATQGFKFHVTGAHCASCVARIDSALSKVDGVISHSFSIADNMLRVDVIAGQVTAPSIITILSQAGYGASSTEAQDRPPADRSLSVAKQRAVWATFLAAPVFITEMGGHLFPWLHQQLMHWFGQTTLHWFQFILATATLAFPGRHLLTTGLTRLAKAQPEMNSLVALGALSAWGYSSFALLWPALLPSQSRNIYFEAAAVIIALILIGRWIESRSKQTARSAIQSLFQRLPETALRLKNGVTTTIPISEIEVGDILLARAGDRIAVDGIVHQGTSQIEEALVTGEALPVEKVKGDKVIGGTVNGAGALEFRASHIGADTVLARIVSFVEQAQAGKLPIQNLADRVVARFVPVVLAISGLSAIAWFLLAGTQAGSAALVAGVSVLIIACPCAMGLATPMSIMVGTGRAAELGVLFKHGSALQTVSEVQTVVFDKTGTLTLGQPNVASVATTSQITEQDTLRLLAAVPSSHPLLLAVQRAAQSKGISTDQNVTDVDTLAGLGMSAKMGDQTYWIGSATLMNNQNIDLSPLAASAEVFSDKGYSLVFLANQKHILACIGLSDTIKPDVPKTIAALTQMGKRTIILSGDHSKAVEHVAHELKISAYFSGVLPEQKAQHVKSIRDQYGAVAFVGDGINDAPALAIADVGIAIGTGADIAAEAADVVLMSQNLGAVLDALTCANATMRNIKQNLGWAFGYNIVLIPVAAGVFYPAFGWQLSPVLAAAAMSLSSICVVGNALRLKRIRGTGKDAIT